MGMFRKQILQDGFSVLRHTTGIGDGQEFNSKIEQATNDHFPMKVDLGRLISGG